MDETVRNQEINLTLSAIIPQFQATTSKVRKQIGKHVVFQLRSVPLFRSKRGLQSPSPGNCNLLNEDIFHFLYHNMIINLTSKAYAVRASGARADQGKACSVQTQRVHSSLLSAVLCCADPACCPELESPHHGVSSQHLCESHC